MHVFESEVIWQQGKQCHAKARENPTMTVATPPDFGGPDGVWSPEELLVASVGSCLFSTFLYFVERFGLPLSSYASVARGTVDRTVGGLRFTEIDVSIRASFADSDTLSKAAALHLKDKLEKYCPVSASLSCPVRVSLDLRQEAAAGAGAA